MKDLFGKAILDYQTNNSPEDIITETSISEADEMSIAYLFRNFKEMPKLEQKALQLAKGHVLDVGCGSGSHSLYLQNKGLKVKAIDISRGAIQVAKLRGVRNAEARNVLNMAETFDTILLLMNGTGVFQKLSQTPKYLRHLKSLLNTNGQILVDSSDLKYMYEDEDGGPDSYRDCIDAKGNYYGELDYFLSYKGENEVPFKMLYLDFDSLKTACETVGLKCELVLEGDHYDYLARLS